MQSTTKKEFINIFGGCDIGKFKKNLYSLFVSLLPIFIIVICGFINIKIHMLSSITFKAIYFITWKIAFYIIFGITLSILCRSSINKRNLYAQIIGFIFIVLLFLYSWFYFTLKIANINIFKISLFHIINLENLMILFGTYFYNTIRMTYMLFNKNKA